MWLAILFLACVKRNLQIQHSFCKISKIEENGNNLCWRQPQTKFGNIKPNQHISLTQSSTKSKQFTQTIFHQPKFAWRMPLKHGQPLNPPLSHLKGLGGIPKRDRSRSLCVDRSTPLLPRWGDAPPKASPPFLGRRGSASGIVGIFHTTNMLLWCHPATLAECESPR